MKHSTPQNTVKTWSIKGGVHPDFNKKISTQRPIVIANIPQQLIIPLKQHIGAVPVPVVNVGDYVFKGQPLTAIDENAQTITAIIHASSSGTVTAIEERPIPHTSGLTGSCIIIETDGKDDWGEYQRESLCNFDDCSLDRLVKRIQQSGIAGLGGAVFPSAVKLSAVNDHQLETLIINAAECEPYITCDDMLIRTQAAEIITGIRILLRTLNPKQCLIGIEDNKPEAIQALQDTLTELGLDLPIRVIPIPTIYPSGDEKQLIRILTGKQLSKNTLPFTQDILVYNIGTVHSIYKAVVKGEPLLSRTVTVTGDGITQPQNFSALIGTPFKDLIAQAEGYTPKAERLLMGGPMMGYFMSSDEVPVVKASNCILATSREALPYADSDAMPCIRCGLCAQACPVDLLPQQLYWYSKAKDFERATTHNLADCIECGCCSYVCPSQIPLVSYYRYAKSEIRDLDTKKQKAEIARERYEFLQFRKERAKAEREAKRAAHKAALEKKKAAEKNAAPNDTSGKSTDNKSDAIKAALERAKAKKAQINTQPRNTDNLSDSQQKQIDEIKEQRKQRRAARANSDNKE